MGARQGREKAESMVLEDPACFGQSDLASQAVEETSTELALQLRHVLGQGGLTQVHGLCGRAEAAGLGDGQEHLELPESRLHKLCLIRRITTSNWSLCKETATLSPVDPLRYEPVVRLSAFVAVFVLLAATEALLPRRDRAVIRWWRWPPNITLVVLNTVILRAALPATALC